ncbi:MAG: hypothetical protein QOK11_2620 [Pseudonocardiales bacterium]|nr:hypothetical protein [Pseudonocardiales bacterium]
MTTTTRPTVVLVRGAFGGASGFADVIRELQTSGYPSQRPAEDGRVGGDG